MRIYRNKVQFALDLWGNLFWGNHFADLLNFGRSQTSSLVSSPKTKFLCKFSKNYESTTAITSIVIALSRIKALNMPSLRGSGEATTKQSKSNRHTERSEVSKTRESKSQIRAMPQKRIKKSCIDSTLQNYDFSNLTLCVLDSSLNSRFAQNDEFGVDCFGDKSPRNDESSANSYKSTTKDTL